MNKKLFAILGLVMFSTGLGLNLVIPLLPVYATTLGASSFALGLIYSAFAVTRAITLPFVDLLVKKLGRLALLRLGLSLGVLVSLGFVGAVGVVQLIICRAFHGLSQALMLPSARSYVGDMIPPGREGRLMGLFEMAFAAGLAMGPFAGGWLKDKAGIGAAFWGMTILSLVTLLIVLLWFKVDPKTIKSSLNKPKSHKAPSLWTVFKNREMLAIGFIRLGSLVPASLIWTFQLIYYNQILKLSGSQTGLILSLHLATFALAQPLAGRLADKINRHKVCFWAGLLNVPLIFIMPHPAHSLFTVLLVNMGLGLTFGCAGPAQFAVAVSYGREHEAMSPAMNYMDLVFSLALAVGPLINGVLADIYGLASLFKIAAAGQLVVCLIYLFLMPHASKKPLAV